MLAMRRKALIKEKIMEHKSVTVSELAERFSVTEETIRRDLKAMEREGLLIRTYGGAYIQDGVQNEINIKVRENACVDSKDIIGQICADLISNGDSIFLDCSTTSNFVCEHIKNKRITVLTNSLNVANILSNRSNINLILIGGTFNPVNMSFVGKVANMALKNFYVDKTFVSSRSLSIEHGITDSSEQDAEIRQTVLNHSSKKYIMADYTKFGKTSFVKINNFDLIDAVITDRPLGKEWVEFLHSKNIAVYDSLHEYEK